MKVLSDVAVGAEWRCVDLHLHTPGVHSFKLATDDGVHTDGGECLLRGSWPERVAALVDDLRHVQEELQATALNPQTYFDAVRERTALEPVVTGLIRQEEERNALTAAPREVQRRRRGERRTAIALRRKAAEAVNAQLDGKLQKYGGALDDA